MFSRYPRRTRWYLKEVLGLGGCVCLFQAIVLAAVILVTLGRYQLQMDSAGLTLLLNHFLIHSLWAYTMAVLINVLALYCGSSTAFAWTAGAQIICIVLLNVGDAVVRHANGSLTYKDVLAWNPIVHLVLGWHQDDMRSSVLFCFLLSVTITAVGAVIIKKYDLLVSDLEMEAG